MRGLLATLAAAVALLGIWASPAQAAPPHVNHVFIVVLENEDGDQTFGPTSQIPYLSQTLASQGAYIPDYYGIAHLSLPNYIAMVSGQAPNPQTQSDCQFFTNFLPGTPTSDGQFIGNGCVYPAAASTVANQLEGAGLTWKGYMQDMAASGPATCRHPTIGMADDTQTAEVADQYAARHNPFVYFHSIIDNPTCAANDVDLGQLNADLLSEATTPNYAFITPDLCNDGHDTPCVDGQPGGMVQANAFLQDLVPKILASPAYKNRGLLIITFDEAEGGTAPGDDASACCGEQSGPNTPNPGALAPGPGGGKIGAVLLSPCIRGGTRTAAPYNHYSLLRSVEDNFGLARLGYAGAAGPESFGDDVFTNPSCSPAQAPPSAVSKAKTKRCKKKRKKHRGASSAKKKRCKKHKRKHKRKSR